MPQFKSKYFHHTHTPPSGEEELVSMQIDIRGRRPYLAARVNDGVPKKKKRKRCYLCYSYDSCVLPQWPCSLLLLKKPFHPHLHHT